MVNPYQINAAEASPPIRRRGVRRYLVLGALLVVAAVQIAYPGLELLNQQWQLIPTRTAIYDIEINGQPVSKLVPFKTKDTDHDTIEPRTTVAQRAAVRLPLGVFAWRRKQAQRTRESCVRR